MRFQLSMSSVTERRTEISPAHRAGWLAQKPDRPGGTEGNPVSLQDAQKRLARYQPLRSWLISSVASRLSPHGTTVRIAASPNYRPALHRFAAFTLIEVMISSALMALILVSAYLCLGAGFSAQKLIEPRAEIIQNARVALALMSADLRAACPLSTTDDFLGMTRTVGDIEADNLDFGTHNYTPRRAREGDFCQESIYLDKNPETGQFSLWRRRNPNIGLDALSGGAIEELAQGVVGLKLEYFDGFDWYDTWGNVDAKKRGQNSAEQPSNLTGLPEAVRITLLMDSNPRKKNPDAAAGQEQPAPPFVFRTVVRLNLADATQDNENAATTTSPDTSSSPGQTPDNGGNN
jgi:prepilin-type N-terminal cleavage/methylation domain-containing protein